jgi:hypothetical protein
MKKLKKVKKKILKIPVSKSDIINKWPDYKKAGTSYGVDKRDERQIEKDIRNISKKILDKRTCVSLFSCSEVKLGKSK